MSASFSEPTVCDHAWVLGEEFGSAEWVNPDGVIIGLGIAGCVCAVAQVVIIMVRKNMTSLAHRGLQAVAVADFFSSLWWAVLAPSKTHHDTYISHESSCRLVEWARVSVQFSALFWMFMLSLLVLLDAYNFYSFGIVSRTAMGFLIFAALSGPAIAMMMIGAWRFTSPCPSSAHDETDMSHFAHSVLTVTAITFIIVSVCVLGGILVKYGKNRGGVWPHRLFAMAVSIAVRGLPGIMQVVGWWGLTCGDSWAQFISVASPLLPVVNFLVYFCRKDIYTRAPQGSVGTSKVGTPRTSISQYSHATPQMNGSVACDSNANTIAGRSSRFNQTCTPQSNPAEMDDASSVPSSLLNLPLKVQQAHLDLLWGCTTQIIMVEKKSHRIVFAPPDSSDGESSYVIFKKKKLTVEICTKPWQHNRGNYTTTIYQKKKKKGVGHPSGVYVRYVRLLIRLTPAWFTLPIPLVTIFVHQRGESVTSLEATAFTKGKLGTPNHRRFWPKGVIGESRASN